VKALWLAGGTAAKFAAGEHPENDLLECPLASVRLRMGVAAREWKRRGNENVFWEPGGAGSGAQIDWHALDICIVTKYFFDLPLEPWLAACRAAKRNRARLVMDICDYPFEKPPTVQAFYGEALNLCDAVVVNSERMAELMAPHTDRRPSVIEDAVLGARADAAFAPAKRVELLWFGHPTNLRYLHAARDALAQFAARRPCRLTVVTQDSAEVRGWVEAINGRFMPALEARFVPWSLQTTRAALDECDIVMIPSDPSDPLKSGASANRIAEALNAGRFPVASPLLSYLPFAEAAWLGTAIADGIEWALTNPDEVLSRIRRGQVLVAERLAGDRIGGQWVDLLHGLANGI
jgi:hypothetical protein